MRAIVVVPPDAMSEVPESKQAARCRFALSCSILRAAPVVCCHRSSRTVPRFFVNRSGGRHEDQTVFAPVEVSSDLTLWNTLIAWLTPIPELTPTQYRRVVVLVEQLTE